MPQTNYIIILICDGTTYVCHTYFIVKSLRLGWEEREKEAKNKNKMFTSCIRSPVATFHS